MDLKERAELVRGLRFEMKQYYNNPRNYDNPNPTSRDTARNYVNEGGGDGDIYDRAARWDRYRATQVPKRRRARTPRAERDPGGYVGYTGDWQAYFQGPRGNPSAVRRGRGK